MLNNKLFKAHNLYKFNKLYRVKKYTQENQYTNYIYEESFNNTIKHNKSHNCIECYYCNSSGWIAWKSNNNNNNNNNILLLDLYKQPITILYTICTKCQLK